MNATVQLRLDRIALSRLSHLGYLRPGTRDPSVIRDAVHAALADRLAPGLPAALVVDERV